MKISTTLDFVLAIALSLLLAQCTSNQKELHRELTRRAAELNQSTPLVLEVHTRFDSVGVSPHNVFQYYYTITNIPNPHELLANKKEDILKNMDERYATDRSLQFFIENKVTMEYIYRDTIQNVIDVITIETGRYKK